MALTVVTSAARFTDHFKGTPYVFITAFESKNRYIEKYLFNNEDTRAAKSAAEAIRRLIEQYPILQPTFGVPNRKDANFNDSLLETEIAENPYLTINDLAICLATEQEAPKNTPDRFIDSWFSGATLVRVTQCTCGHFLEWKRAAFWQEKYKVCPAGHHSLGNLNLQNDRQKSLRIFRKTREQLQNDTQMLVLYTQFQQLQVTHYQQRLRRSQQQIAVLQNQATQQLWDVGRDTGTAIIKIVPKLAATGLGTQVVGAAVATVIQYIGLSGATMAARSWTMTVLKNVPWFSAGVGLTQALFRAWRGEYVKAGAECV